MIRASVPARQAHCPRFPKPKDEQWWVILGDPATGELLALKRVSKVRKFVATTLTFEWDEDWDDDLKQVLRNGETKMGYTFCVYLICDCYIGMDMQYAFDVAKPDMEERSSEEEGEDEDEDDEEEEEEEEK